MKRSPQRRPAVLAVVFSVLATSHAVKTAVDSQSQNDAASGASPVGKAVKLLGDLKQKTDQAKNMEEMTYMKFEMWCQLESQKNQYIIKTNEEKQDGFRAEIAKAETEMKAASMHLAELASNTGTDEADLKAATMLREKENSEFKALESEIVEGLESTANAMAKLEQDIEKAGSADGKAFLQKSSQQPKPSKALQAFGEVMEEVAAAEQLSVENDMTRYPSLLEQAEERSAARSMDRVESELDRLGSGSKGDVPVETIKENLALLKDVKKKSMDAMGTARSREARYARDFEKLRKALQGKIMAMANDLANTKQRLADATANKADCDGEMAVCDADIKAAQEYLAKVGQDCMEKANQYEQQKKGREDEIQAIGNALDELKRIMHTDAAKGSLSFLQLGALAFHQDKQHGPRAFSLVLKKVEDLAANSENPALEQLSSRMNAMSRYGAPQDDSLQKVRETIEEMVEKLEKTNSEDLNKKAFCDQEMKNTQDTHAERKATEAKTKAALNLKTAEVAQLRQDMADLSNELAELAKQDRERSKMREEEHKAHVKAYKDLEEGLSGVQGALKALRDFYNMERPEKSQDMGANMALASGKPPDLSTAPVNENAGAGVIGLIEVIAETFSNNMATLQAQDRNAQELFEELMAESKVLTAQKEGDLKHATQQATAVERRVSELMSDHSSAQQQLEAVEEYMEKLTDECTIKVESREERIKKREQEVQGLKEALAVLDSER